MRRLPFAEPQDRVVKTQERIFAKEPQLGVQQAEIDSLESKRIGIEASDWLQKWKHVIIYSANCCRTGDTWRYARRDPGGIAVSNLGCLGVDDIIKHQHATKTWTSVPCVVLSDFQ